MLHTQHFMKGILCFFVEFPQNKRVKNVFKRYGFCRLDPVFKNWDLYAVQEHWKRVERLVIEIP